MAMRVYISENDYEKDTLSRVNQHDASALSVAGNVLDYSVYSLQQRWKARHSNELITEAFASRTRKCLPTC